MNRSILIVDDDEISRLVLASLLRRMPGVGEVVEAFDGEDAWGKLQEGFRPVLCCCDLMMPNLDGVGLLIFSLLLAVLGLAWKLPFGKPRLSTGWRVVPDAAPRVTVRMAASEGPHDDTGRVGV